MPRPSANPGAAKRTLYELYPALAENDHLLTPTATVLDYGPGEALFQRNAPVTHIFFVRQGSIEERGLKRRDRKMQSRLARTVQPTPQRTIPVLGLYNYLYQEPYSTHAWAAAYSEVLVIDVKTFEKIVYQRPDLVSALAPLALIDRLRTVPLLGQLEPIELGYVADAVELQTIPAESVIQPNAPGGRPAMLYVIDRGQVEVSGATGRTLLGNGAAFGFLGVDDIARTLVESTLLAIERQALLDLVNLRPEIPGMQLRQSVQSILSQLYVFSNPAFTPSLLARLAGYVSHYVIPQNTLLAQQGEMSDWMWVLLPGATGQLYALDEAGQALTASTVEGPNYFCEAALLAQSLVDSTVEAEKGSQWLRLHRADFQAFARAHGWSLLNQLRLRREIQWVADVGETSQRYGWLQEGEGVVWLSRRHWVMLLVKTWGALVVILVMLVGWVARAISGSEQPWLPTLLYFLGLGGLGLLLWGLYDYWNDFLVVTTRRLVRQEQRFLQSYQLQETGLEQIRNVDSARGFWGQILGYGLLRVQTAGREGVIAFDFIPEIEQVQRALITQMTRRRQYREAASKLEIQKQLEGRLGLRLSLPERVRPLPTRPNLIRTWWQWLVNWLANRRQRRRDRYQQERVVWRKFWLILLGRLFWPTLILIGCLLFLLAPPAMISRQLSAEANQPLRLFVTVAGLVALGVVAWRFSDWHNDTYEVTREEVADVEKLPLFFDEKRRTARLLNIDNIRTELPSTLHYLLNFGHVRLETAAEQGDFTFNSVFDPNGVATEIRRRIDAARQREESERARQRSRELTDWFEMYTRIKPES